MVMVIVIVIVMVVRHAGVGLFFFLSFDPVLYKFEMHDIIIIKECNIHTNIAKELVFY